MRKVGILEPDHFSQIALGELEKHFEVECYQSGDIKEFVQDKEIIFVRLAYEISDELLAEAKKIQYICSPTTGLNHITTKNQLKIVCLKGEQQFLSTIRATPEHTFGLALGLLRNYRYACRDIKNAEWNRDLYRGEEIYQNSVGIIGYGRVGRIIANYYLAFGAKVSFFDIDESVVVQENVKKEACLEDLIRNNQIIHMCASYSDEYKGYFDEKYFELLEGKYFINTARGELIDETALIAFIEKGNFKGVGIDVLTGEAEDHFNLEKILMAAEGKNVMITPHISGATYSSMMRTEEFIVDKLLRTMKANGEL